jgi:hypothetical protein
MPAPTTPTSSESDRLLLDRHASSKQITVGEASLGWVDLMRGILLLTGLFDDRPVLTYIPLPAEKVCITDRRGYPHYAPEYFCDVVVCSGDLIKFVELDFEDPGCRDNGKSWRATTWSRKVSWDDWRKHRTVDVSEISVDPSYSALLPGLVVDDERQQELQLKKLYFLNPTLSVRDHHILYMLAKVDERDDTAWVLALQMEHAALQALVPVSTRESHAITMFCACLFPKYYMDNITSGMVTTLPFFSSFHVPSLLVIFFLCNCILWTVGCVCFLRRMYVSVLTKLTHDNLTSDCLAANKATKIYVDTPSATN